MAPFAPFFTLVEDSTGPEPRHFRPSVHYVFEDDPAERADLITDAALQSLPSERGGNVAERYILVDVETPEAVEGQDTTQDARLTVTARSLAPEWQVVSASLERAPTWGDAADGPRGPGRPALGEEKGDGNSMLRIRGTSGRGNTTAPSRTTTADLNELVRTFQTQLAELTDVVKAGNEQCV